MAENPLAPGPLQKPSTGKGQKQDNRTPYQKALDEQKKSKKGKKEMPGDSIMNPAPSRDGLAPGKFYVDPETGDIMQVVGPGFYDAIVLRAEQATAITGEENTLKSLEEKLSQAKIAYEPFDPTKRPTSALKEPENVPFEGKLTSKKALKEIIDSLEKQIKKISSTISPLKEEANALREEVAQDQEYEKQNAPGKRLSPQERAAKIRRAQELELQAATIEKTGDVQATKPTLPPTTTTTVAPTTTITTTPATTTTTPGATPTTQPRATTTTTAPQVKTEETGIPLRPVRGIGATAAQMRAANLPSPRTAKTKPTTTTTTTGATTTVGGATTGTTGGATTGGGKAPKAKVNEEELRKQYPGYAWVFDLGPEFKDTKDLVVRMLLGPENGGITYERFQAMFPQSSFVRDGRVAGQKRKILDRYGDVALPTTSLMKLINDSISFQYDDTDLDNAFYNEVFRRDPLTNDLVNKQSATAVLNGTAATTIRNYANSMFTSASDKDIEDVLSGRISRETYQSNLRTVAKNVYRNWATVLEDPNMTMEDIVKPWKNMAAQVLEMDPNQIDMTKPQFAAAYSGTDASGNPAAMSLGDWYVKLRTDPTYGWKNTTGAKQEARDMAFKLATAFGKII